jgi:hypothetical protein
LILRDANPEDIALQLGRIMILAGIDWRGNGPGEGVVRLQCFLSGGFGTLRHLPCREYQRLLSVRSYSSSRQITIQTAARKSPSLFKFLLIFYRCYLKDDSCKHLLIIP